MESKIKNLIEFCQGIYRKENGRELYNKYLEEIKTVTPQDVLRVEYEQLKMGITPKEMLTYVDKLINVFYKSLNRYKWERPEQDTFLYYLMKENHGLLEVLNDMKVLIKRQDYVDTRLDMLQLIKSLREYNGHLLKLENILFPYMEKKKRRFEGLKIMWSLHDDARHDLNELVEIMSQSETDEMEINVKMGRLFFMLNGMVQKQELILFPLATELLSREEFEAMHNQSFDYSFPFISAPIKKEDSSDMGAAVQGIGTDTVIHTKTGVLSFEQVELLINALPVDVTLVDEHDQVVFFSRPKERIFPRSVAIIGRNVRNCHPPESVHVVEEIIDSFRSGVKSEESFWIQMKDLFVLIQYFALRNEKGDYKGVLEVSQEISHIKTLEGEKKLLD